MAEADLRREAVAMIPEFKELIILPVAMILFLCAAASTSPSLTWRADPPAQIASASR